MGVNEQGSAAGQTVPLQRFPVSLAELVAGAADGDTVMIPDRLVPGSGPVRIRRNLRLVSAGAEVPDDIVVHGPAALEMSGITATGVLTALPGTRLSARDCQFTPAPGRAPVSVVGSGCVVELTECRFSGADVTAVRLGKGAVARLRECDFAPFVAPSITVSNPGTTLDVSDCRFAGTSGHAVLAEDAASARVTGCLFEGYQSERWTAVIAVSSGSSVDVSGCTFGPMTAHGVFVRGGSSARVDNCGFTESAELAAVFAMDDHSALQVTGCRFTAITGRGVEVNDGAVAEIGDCELQAVGELAPVYAEGAGSRASLAGCLISSAHTLGAAASGSAELDVADCGFDCPGARLADGAIGLGRDGSRLRITGACSLRGSTGTVTRTLSHTEAVAGTTVALTTTFGAPCPACNGSGARPGSQLTACNRSHHHLAAGCPDCHGSGLHGDDPCPDCDGAGGHTRERSLEIDVPAGVQTGQTLIAPGNGGGGLGSGAPGDLHVVVSVTEPFRTVEEYFEKALGVRVAAADERPVASRGDLDEAVRREAIRLGYLPADGDDGR